MTQTRPLRPEDDAAPARIAAERLQGVVMVAVLVFGIWQGIAALSTPTAQRQFDGKLNVTALLAGQTAAAVNTIMAHDLPTDRLWRMIGGVVRWSLFGSGGPQVWVGAQGWLYLTEELRPWPEAEANMQARARTLHAIAAKLQAQNITLVTTLVPDKARIQQDTLGSAPRAAQAIPRYEAFAALLKAGDIAFVDLNAAFVKARRDGPLYYRTDTHWNQRGAALAAATVASAVTLPHTTDFRTDADTALTDGPGDLLRLMSLETLGDRWAPLLRPLPDRQHLEHTVSLAPPAEEGGLLDDAPVAPAVLIGSSFSLNANFAGRLQEALHTQVANFGELGGGFAGAAQKYFNGLAFKETPPKLVIWEIPERVIGQPLDDSDRALAHWAGQGDAHAP